VSISPAQRADATLGQERRGAIRTFTLIAASFHPDCRVAGCRCLFEEAASGGRWDRPELHRLLDHLREGDTVVVWKLDRLSRSLKDVLHVTENIDTTTPAGRMMMQIVGAFAEFERAMIRERTSAVSPQPGPKGVSADGAGSWMRPCVEKSPRGRRRVCSLSICGAKKSRKRIAAFRRLAADKVAQRSGPGGR
jgi:hypothetical protein